MPIGLELALWADLSNAESLSEMPSIVADTIQEYMLFNIPSTHELDVSFTYSTDSQALLPILPGSGSLFSLPALQQAFTANALSLMGTGGKLNNVTGRLLGSARLTSPTTFSYMEYPYAVFEKDPLRSPTKLFQEALTKASVSIYGSKKRKK